MIVREDALASAARVKTASSPASPLAPTIFHEPWWLDVTTDGAFEEVVVSADGMVVGRLPYLRTKVGGFSAVRMPPMTYALGPALISATTKKTANRNLRELAITRDLIAQLPKVSHVWLRLHADTPHTLAFDSAGYINTLQYTVEVAPDTREVLWLRMRDKTRNIIRRAQEQLRVDESFGCEQFLAFFDANLRDRGQRNTYDREVCDRVIRECVRRGAGRILAATDPTGNLDAAIFVVWDKVAAYFLLSTRSMESMNGATSLLIWSAIQQAAEKGLIFDMAGLHVRNSEIPNLHLLNGFGGSVRPRFVVRKSTKLVEFCKLFRT